MIMCKSTKCVLIAISMLFQCAYGQDIIFRNENEDYVQQRSTARPSRKIPEELLITMKDVRNVEEFINRFVSREDNMIINGVINITGNGPSVSSRRGSSGVPTSSISGPADCQPEEQIVELEKPGDPSIILWPSCVRVRRCGGCCSSTLLDCEPSETSFYNATVLQVKYHAESPGSLKVERTQVFSLEQHDRCLCRCREKAEDCIPNVHHYSEQKCRCICTNENQAADCIGPNKIWDSNECVCKCRGIRHCSTGRIYSPTTCRCEIWRNDPSGDF